MTNYTICNCRNVSFFDVEDALHDYESLTDVENAFSHVQEVTHCTTGCGSCYQKILDAISDIMHR
ncbi:MAG: (2Fe-2S)-binding protein [Lachnospiraceae bacterium]|nr:(2Fe-2S)-binding protein [Lachnospiraceae bacterium]